MSIQSSVIDIYVEPQVSSIELVASPVLNSGSSLTLTFSGTAYDSDGLRVPYATLTFSIDVFTIDTTTPSAPSASDIISASKSAGTQQVAVTALDGSFSFTASGTFEPYVAAVVSGEGVNSNVVYAYANCTISISASTTTPEVGTAFTVTVDVGVNDGPNFVSSAGNNAMLALNGYATVVLYHEDISTGVISHSILATDSSGAAAFSVTLSTIGGHKLQAVAYGTDVDAKNASPPSDL
jgi:hypothetical protein